MGRTCPRIQQYLWHRKNGENPTEQVGFFKKKTKKDLADVKASTYQTGGGPAIEKKLDVVGERILGIIGVSATGTVNTWDSDFIGEFAHSNSVRYYTM